MTNKETDDATEYIHGTRKQKSEIRRRYRKKGLKRILLGLELKVLGALPWGHTTEGK